MKEQESIKAKLLRMYNDLMYEQGYEQTTVRQIADKCGIGRGHLYFYFSKKEQFPIALRADLLKKIDIIISEFHPDLGDRHLLHFLLSLKLVRYMFSERRELYRAQAEYASHTEVLDGFAELQYPGLARGLSGLGLTITRELMEESLLSATYSEYALIKYRYHHFVEHIDHGFLFNHFCSALFAQFTFLEETLNEARREAAQLFNLHAGEMLRRVYELDAYNYANGDSSPPS